MIGFSLKFKISKFSFKLKLINSNLSEMAFPYKSNSIKFFN